MTAMALTALSDLLLAGTLIVNAGASLNFKLPQPLDDAADGSNFRDRAISLISSLRVFRIMIALWNVLILALMVLWFP